MCPPRVRAPAFACRFGEAEPEHSPCPLHSLPLFSASLPASAMAELGETPLLLALLSLSSSPAPFLSAPSLSWPRCGSRCRRCRLLTRLASHRPPQAKLRSSGGALGAGTVGAGNGRCFATIMPSPAMPLHRRAAGSRGRANSGRLGPSRAVPWVRTALLMLHHHSTTAEKLPPAVSGELPASSVLNCEQGPRATI